MPLVTFALDWIGLHSSQITLLSRDFFRARITQLIDIPVAKILGRGLQSEHSELTSKRAIFNTNSRRLNDQGMVEWGDDFMDERQGARGEKGGESTDGWMD